MKSALVEDAAPRPACGAEVQRPESALGAGRERRWEVPQNARLADPPMASLNAGSESRHQRRDPALGPIGAGLQHRLSNLDHRLDRQLAPARRPFVSV
jgi:hypothetical protein